jgi:hypothetical protein
MDIRMTSERLGLLILTVLFLISSSWNGAGTGNLSESGSEFLKGQMTSTQLTHGNLTLSSNQSLATSWVEVEDGLPLARSGHSMAYDNFTGTSLMFGGRFYDGVTQGLNDTWSYDSIANNWMNRKPSFSPPEPYAESMPMAYDRNKRMLVLIEDESNTWAYDVGSSNWSKKSPASAPEQVSQSCMVFDSKNGVFIQFGGYETPPKGETWTYNLSSDAWTNKNPSKPPVGRYGHAMAYDSKNARTVLFGGGYYNGGGPSGHYYFSDLWLYDFGTNTWTNKTPASGPSARERATLVYDATNDRIVLFGGYNETYLNDTWVYDLTNNTWSEKKPVSAPRARDGQAMVFDESCGCTILFGGWYSFHWGDTWKYNLSANAWTEVSPSTSPSCRGDPAMAYDEKNNVTVLYGGDGWTRPLYDTWTYDGTRNLWTEKKPASHPSARVLTKMVYDSRAGAVVLFGGYPGDTSFYEGATWAYDAGLDSWVKKNPATAPSPRIYHSMAYDSQNGVAVLFGGWDETHVYLNDTWIYNFSEDKWTKKNPSNPPPGRGCAGMSFDASSGLVVLFGGGDTKNARNDTWTYNVSNNTWTRKNPGSAPSIRIFPGMVYDSACCRTVLHGGSGNVDTWAYYVENDTWTNLKTRASPGFRVTFGMAYDKASNISVIFGGENNDSHLGDTWVLGLEGFNLTGEFLSQAEDLGARARIGALGWTGLVAQNSSLRFRIRGADSQANLTKAQFQGPQGPSSYHNSSGEYVFSELNGSRWIQYKAYLNSSDRKTTPTLVNVTINYNLIQSIAVRSPRAGDNWTGTRTVSWNASDQDGDTLSFDIWLLNETGRSRLASVLAGNATEWSWETTATPNGTYRIMIAAIDGNADLPVTVNATSGAFTIFHPPPPNNPPAVRLLLPSDGAQIVSTGVQLSWTGSDLDNDPLDYSVFISSEPFDMQHLPAGPVTTPAPSHGLENLTDGVSYHWTVLADDGKDQSFAPEIRSFTIRLPPPNHLPSVELVSPANGSTLSSTSANLSWAGRDPDGDPLNYFVVWAMSPFGLSALPPPAALTNESWYEIPSLLERRTYYWTVVASDGKQNGSAAPVWHFEVEFAQVENRPPVVTSTPPLNVNVGERFEYNVTARDDDGDALTFVLVAAPPGMSFDNATGRISWVPGASDKGNHTVTVRVQDGKGGAVEHTFSLQVHDPRHPPATGPTCSIVSPRRGQSASRVLQVKGTALRGTQALARIDIRLDGGAWQAASGLENWTFALDTAGLKNGNHTLEARAFDGTRYSDSATVDFLVSNPKAGPSQKGFLPGFAALPLLAAAGALLILRRPNKT